MLLSLGCLVCWSADTLEGQARALQRRLATATGLSCSFSAMATGDWQDGTPSVEAAPAKISVTFTHVNIDEGTADAEGMAGVTFIVVRYSNDYLHLIQMHGSGPLYTTTVVARESHDGRLLAVHTRHEYTDVRLPGFTSRPEMYVGDCEVES